jgi:hypothetical protein
LIWAVCAPGFNDAVAGRVPKVNSNVRGNFVGGQSLHPTGNGQQMQWSNAHLAGALSGGSFVSAMVYGASTNWFGGGFSDIIRCDGTVTPFQSNGSVFHFTFWVAAGTSFQGTVFGSISAGPHVLIATLNSNSGTGLNWSLDGGPLTNASVGGTGNLFGGNTTDICLGGTEAGAEGWVGDIGVAALWNRMLSQAEATSLAANPYQIFAPVLPYSFPLLVPSSSPVLVGQSSPTSGGTNNLSGGGGSMYWHVFTAITSGVATSLNIYIRSVGSANGLNLALYDVASGALLASGSPTLVAGLCSIPITANIFSGRQYALAYQGGSNNLNFVVVDDGTNNQVVFANNTAGSFPSTLPAGSGPSNLGIPSIYVSGILSLTVGALPYSSTKFFTQDRLLIT